MRNLSGALLTARKIIGIQTNIFHNSFTYLFNYFCYVTKYVNTKHILFSHIFAILVN